jgi:hypothetical protein
LGGGGVALGVVDQLGKLGGQFGRQLVRDSVERWVEGEHRLGVDGLDLVVGDHLGNRV